MKTPFKSFTYPLYQSKPTNITRIKNTSISIYQLQRHINYLQTLTQLVKDILPSHDVWQVAALTKDTLCIATDNHTSASKLRYTQAQYIQKLKEIPELESITKLKIIVEPIPEKPAIEQFTIAPLSEATKKLLESSAKLFTDPEISESLYRLASKK